MKNEVDVQTAIVGRSIQTRRLSELRIRKDSAGNFHAVGIPCEGDLSFAAKQVLTKVRALRDYTQATGFRTTKSQNDLIQSLDGDDLASVLLILNKNTALDTKNTTGRPFSATSFASDEQR